MVILKYLFRPDGMGMVSALTCKLVGLTASASLTLCVRSRDRRAASLSMVRSMPSGCSCSFPASAAAWTADRASLRAVSAAMLSARALCNHQQLSQSLHT